MMLVMISPFYMLWLSVFGIPWDKLRTSVNVLPKGYLIAAHGMYWLVVNLATLPSLGLASDGVFSPHAVLLHALVTSIVLVMVIFYRAKRIEENRPWIWRWLKSRCTLKIKARRARTLLRDAHPRI